MSLPGGAPTLRRNSLPFLIVVVLLLAASVVAQQPNGTSAMVVQFRQGPPYPIVATAPNNGLLSAVLFGSPGAPFVIATGPLLPGATTLAGQSWDVGTPPAFNDVQILANGISSSSSGFNISPLGFKPIQIPIPANTTIAVPPVQAIVIDPTSPSGFTVTAASAITFLPTKSVLFLQGDFDPGFGFGPQCRLADTSPVGFSTLGGLLGTIGFSGATEVVDTTVTVTPQLLSSHGLVVLGTNHKTFTVNEVDAIENFVRGGGGLVSYSDSMFGPGSAPSDNQVLARFGLLTAADNFGGTVLATTFTPHPISTALIAGVRGEGVSIIEIVGNATDSFVNVAPCISNATACLPYPGVAPSGSATPTYSACAAVSAGLGRVVATFDRNTFFNAPGYGSNILDASNFSYAINLFLWSGGY